MRPLQDDVERLTAALEAAARRAGLLALVLNGELVIRGAGQARVWQAGPASPGWRLIWQAKPGDTPAIISVRSWEHARDMISAELESRAIRAKAIAAEER